MRGVFKRFQRKIESPSEPKVLLWRSRNADRFFDISTPERRAGTFLYLFNELRRAGCYEHVEDERVLPLERRLAQLQERKNAGDLPAVLELDWARTELNNLAHDLGLFRRALRGDADAAESLLWSHRSFEYEEIEEIEIEQHVSNEPHPAENLPA